MPNKLARIILDTNLWISFLIKKDYIQLDRLLFSNQIKLIFSKELLDEFIAVAKRAKFRKYFSYADLENLVDTIEEFAEFVEVKSSILACRDDKDNFLLSLAIDSGADYLITGDMDLSELNPFESIAIVTIKDFLNHPF